MQFARRRLPEFVRGQPQDAEAETHGFVPGERRAGGARSRRWRLRAQASCGVGGRDASAAAPPNVAATKSAAMRT